MTKLFTKDGLNIIGVKTILLSDNHILRNIAMAGIGQENIEDKVVEALKDENVPMEEFLYFLLTNNYYIDQDKRKMEIEKLSNVWEKALTHRGLEKFQVKEIDGSLVVVRKVGYNKTYFMRHFRMKGEEFEKELQDDFGFFEKYAKLKLLAELKDIKDRTLGCKAVNVDISDFYYDKEFKTYNRNILIKINCSLLELICTNKVIQSAISEIAIIFQEF